MLEPSLSGVIGLLCCALGHDRAEGLGRFQSLRMHVREDRAGTLLTDFHTAGGGMFRGSEDYFAPTSSGGKGKNPVVTRREYLQDASFLAVLEGEEALLDDLAAALLDPVWPLSLGRRSCPPSTPVYAGRWEGEALDALREAPDGAPSGRRERVRRAVVQLPPGDLSGEPREDVPLAWTDRLDRRYGVRYVRATTVELAEAAA
jgi:CRISPR system Cascade subunit CasD